MTTAPDAPQSAEQTPEPPETHTGPQRPSGGSPETHHEATTPPAPVAEIRAAVAKLRKHLKHATESPWHARPVWSPDAVSTSAVYSHAYPTGAVESEVVASGRIRSGYGGIREPWNAEYIALMQPAVGKALADWLHLEADVIEARAIEDGTGEFAVDLSGDHALTIARLINGDDTPRALHPVAAENTQETNR